MEKIDFVILWVDGNDPEWQKDKEKYKKKSENNTSNQNNRFRDWDLLKYWFRGVEQNAPWVNKIHFITYGHLPDWLDTTNPKLNIVKHEDYIPKEYLPTFNSNVIQYYLKDIPNITENFVMFDDDQFILKQVKETDFFINGIPREEYGESLIFSSKQGDAYPHSLLNNIQCINSHYSKREIYKKHFFKYFNFKYGFENILKTFLLLPYSFFAGFYNPHICQCYTKKHYNLFWEYCGKELKEASNNKFRENSDLTTFLIRYIELMEGDFVPRSHRFGRRMELGINNKKIYDAIVQKKYSVLCINDSRMDIDFDKTQKELAVCFEKIFPQKSSFEK